MQTISNEEIWQLVDNKVNLPSPPAIAVQILSTVQKEDFSLDDLEKIISADPALTSKMLRLANSSFYALPNKVSNISRALAVLGTNVIKNIALSFVIAADLRNEHKSYFDFDYFWRRSVTTAVAAELVFEALGEKDEDIFVTALLQDIGILVMFLSQGKNYVEVLKKSAKDDTLSLIEAEREQYQFDHQYFGALLLEDWGIPTSITEPMRYHHEPDRAADEFSQKAHILDVAHLLSAIYSDQETVQNVKKLQGKLESFFSMESDKTRELLDNVATQSIEILKIFEIDPGDIRPYSQMLQEANDELGKLNLSYEQLVLDLKQSKEKAESFANELRNANDKLEKLAFRDGLTNLYNHRYFQEILAKEIARVERYGRPLALLLFDIDHFKIVNDTYGHPAGDQVLISMAQAITKAVRPSDIIARYGGEEFAVILPETDFSGMKVFAERLRRCVAAIVTKTGGHSIKITISCGGAHFSPGDEISPGLLISTSDRALYMSKKNGRNMVTSLSVRDSDTSQG
ncbi:MAG: diguanylate cyclase (GGDEF)-like protein [Desulforhopalus sp.]|jgi:diguanylate cyclase (GGDEF)-like protein